jgi:hypothetical protein
LLAAQLGEAINATCLDGAVPATLWVPRRRLRCTLVRGIASVDGNEPARRAAELFMPVGPRHRPVPEFRWTAARRGLQPPATQ